MEASKAQPEALMREASKTAAFYMREAQEEIDLLYHVGYARQNPDLVAAFMKVAAQDYAIGISAALIERAQADE